MARAAEEQLSEGKRDRGKAFLADVAPNADADVEDDLPVAMTAPVVLGCCYFVPV